MITHILYRSYSNGPVDTAQLRKIRDRAQANNLRDGVTSLLLYRDKMFLQLLEGPRANVMQTFHRIRGDQRHYGTRAVLQAESVSRLFPMWGLAYIPERNILRTFDTLTVVVKGCLMNGLLDRDAMMCVLSHFADINYLISERGDGKHFSLVD